MCMSNEMCVCVLTYVCSEIYVYCDVCVMRGLCDAICTYVMRRVCVMRYACNEMCVTKCVRIEMCL